MSKSRPVTIQRVHAVLRKAGHERAKWNGCGRRYSEGYFAMMRLNGIEVEHHNDNYLALASRAATIRMKLNAYHEALAAAGIECSMDDHRISIPVD